MFIGHFSLGLGLKRADKTLSLGLLFIATQLPDLIYGFNLLTGIEKVNIVASSNPLTAAEYPFYPYSHSLLATLLWAGLVALIILAATHRSSQQKSKTALIMSTAVLSHFFLDVITHNPDIDLLGNGAFKIGLGLWNSPVASYIVEAVLLVTGLWIYLRATKGATLSGKYGLPSLTAILLILNAVSTFGPPPTNIGYFAVMVLVAYLGTIFAAFWLDKKRS
jgi:membrane-bound metal-dependent hydrolase YbcI (DUF457 family)